MEFPMAFKSEKSMIYQLTYGYICMYLRKKGYRFLFSVTLDFTGGSNRIRTCDPLLVRQVL
jgi:hypothetical protein